MRLESRSISQGERKYTWLGFIDSLSWISFGVDMKGCFFFWGLSCVNSGYRSTAALPETQYGVPPVASHGKE